MAELAAVLAERRQHVEASADIFESESKTPQQSPAKMHVSVREEESRSPGKMKHFDGRARDGISVSDELNGRVRRCSMVIEGAIQQQQSLPSRLSSFPSRICALSTSGEVESMHAELTNLRLGFCESLTAISVQDFKTQAVDWLAIVEGCCGSVDARISEEGWLLLLEVFRSKRMCSDHLLTSLPLNFDTSLCNLLREALSTPATHHVSYAVEILIVLASLWPGDADTDAASPMLLADGAALLESLAEASATLLVDGHVSSQGSLLLEMLMHVGDGGIVHQKLEAASCAGVGRAARVLAILACKSSDAHVCETTLLAAGQLAILAAQSADSEAIEDAALVLQGFLCHAKCGKFVGSDARLNCIRTIRSLADFLLSNRHANRGVHEQVASLGIPSEQISTRDISLLWWILQLNPRALGVNAQTVDCELSKRLISVCVNSSSGFLIDRLSQICLGAKSTTGDGMARHHSLALLIHLSRASEDMMRKFSSKRLCEQCFEEAGSWSTEDLLNAASENFETMIDLSGCQDGPRTMIYMALCAWLPCNSEGTRAWVVKKTFPVLSATLMRMLAQRNSSDQPWDATPYADYLLRWYITTGGEFVTVAGFFHLICALVSLPDDTPMDRPAGDTCSSGLFLQAVALALDRFNPACHVPPPGRMLEKALADTKCLLSMGSPTTHPIVAQFFSSALSCHRPNVRSQSDNQELSSWLPCYAFLVSSVFPVLWDAVGETHAEDVRKLVESGESKANICRSLEKTLLRAGGGAVARPRISRGGA